MVRAFAAALTCLPSVAVAQVRATATVGSGVIDNPRGATDASAASADAYFLARLGLDGAITAPRADHRLALQVAATTYARDSAASTLMGQARGASVVRALPSLTLTLGGGATYAFASDPNTPARLGSDGAPAPSFGSQLLGRRRYLLLDASETAVWAMRPTLELVQGLDASYYRPTLDGAAGGSNETVEARIGPRLTMARDWLSLIGEVGCAWRGLSIDQSPTAQPSGRFGPYVDAQLDWRHQLSPTWIGRAGAGVVAYPSGDSTELAPMGVAGLDWSDAPRSAQFLVSHTARPQVFLGAMSMVDSVSAAGDLRLGRSESVRLSALAMIASAKLLGDAVSSSRYTTVTGQAALGWTPWPAQAIDLALVYTYTEQRGQIGTPPVSQTVRRNTALLTLTIAVPTVRQ